jgi:hypothetical protein
MRPETLLRGKAAAVPAWKTALGALATPLGWTHERRQRIGRRLAGGFGTTAILPWLRRRGEQVVAKSSQSGRGRKLCQALGPWQPTASSGREMAAGLPPQRFGRTTRQGVVRPPRRRRAIRPRWWSRP